MRVSLPTAIRTTRRPLIEVVIPCYNYADYLPQCVDTVAGQLGVEVKITIVDDASTDKSLEVAEELAIRHAQVNVLRNQVNAGSVATFNRGLSQVDSDYVLLLSADDMLAPGALSRACALFEANPDVGLVYGHSQKFSERPTVNTRPLPFVSWTVWPGAEWIELQMRRSWNNISSPEAVVRTRVQHEAGYYDLGLAHTHDVDMWLRIAAISDVGHINGIDQAYYRRHPNSHSSQFSMFQGVEERWRAYSQFLDSWARVDRAALIRPQVQRRLSDEALTYLIEILGRGAADEAMVASVLDLVQEIDPRVTERSAWRYMDRMRNGQRHDLADLPRAVRMQLAEATGWQRWHRYRYFG